jgi:hypothetical protein
MVIVYLTVGLFIGLFKDIIIAPKIRKWQDIYDKSY